MDRELSRTLSELERRLYDLERTLAALGSTQQGRTPPARQDPAGARSAPPPPSSAARPPSPPQPTQPYEHFSVPSAEGERGRHHTPEPAARVVDEGGRRQAGVDERGSRPDAIELAELDRFRERLARTLTDLIDDYSRIIALQRTSSTDL